MKNSVANTLVLKTVFFSLLITLPFIWGHMYYEYRQELKNIDKAFLQIEISKIKSLTTAVWFVDRNQVESQLEGILKTSPFAKVTLDAKVIGKVEHNSSLSSNGKIKKYDLINNDDQLGTLTIQASNEPMYNSLLKRFFIIFISVILNTFFVASFALYQFSKYVTRPLEGLSKIVRQASIDQSHLLSRPAHNDSNLNELEEIDFAIAEMRSNFQNSHNELMKTQEQIENMKKISTIGELTASVSHDFKNFLSIMIHTLEILKRNGENPSFNINDEKNQKHITNAFEAAEKANNLITTLLDYSYHHNKEPINLNLYDHLQDMRGLLEVAITKRIQLNINLKDQQIKNCNLDINILDSALLNLCVNAKDAIKNNGEIQIELSNVTLSNRTPAQNGDYVLLKFSDNGHGMTPEVQKKVFEPFYTTKPPGKGTGLGLSMVSNFVKNAGGFVEVQSIEGVGTSFFLYFRAV